jgi:hypothetical protein
VSGERRVEASVLRCKKEATKLANGRNWAG